MKIRVSFSFVFVLIVFSLTSTAQNTITVTTGTADIGRPARTVKWRDANNEERSAVMVDHLSSGTGDLAGYLRQFTYKVAGVDRVCRGSGAYGSTGTHWGDGFVQNHTAVGGDVSSHRVPGTTAIPLNGTHHYIIDYYMPTYRITSPANSYGAISADVPTRVQWFFATGRNYPIFSITQDARATPGGNIGADSRSPYGDMYYDGYQGASAYASPFTGDKIGGASWGDTRKWVSLANGTTNESVEVTTNSGWRYDEPNTIPYAMQWTKTVNAEWGHVLTQPILIKDAGLNVSPVLANTQRLNGPMINLGNSGSGTGSQESFQILGYDKISSTGGYVKRLSWGTNYGFPGGWNDWWSGNTKTDFTRHYNGTRTNAMLMAYSVFDVFDVHTGGYKNGATGKMVQQMENMQKATLTASIGTVKTSGPAGVGLTSSAANNVTYVPAGYNHIFATWEMNAASNKAGFTFTPAAASPIENPIFVLNDYTSAILTTVAIDGALATPDVDYFATVDAANSKAWITLNRTVSAATTIVAGAFTLPLDLTQFTAKKDNGQAVLNWQTANEINTSYFQVEHSTDGITFSPVGKINTTGNATGDYSLTHNSPKAGKNYYRLKMVDLDAQYSYSKIASVSFDEELIQVLERPHDVITINYGGSGNGEISLFDAKGKQLKKIGLQKHIQLPIHDLPKGMYVITVRTSGGSSFTKKIIKK